VKVACPDEVLSLEAIKVEFTFQPVNQNIALLNETLPGPKPCFTNHQNVTAKQQ